eukprot:2738723-Rhodomonas_salina.9
MHRAHLHGYEVQQACTRSLGPPHAESASGIAQPAPRYAAYHHPELLVRAGHLLLSILRICQLLIHLLELVAPNALSAPSTGRQGSQSTAIAHRRFGFGHAAHQRIIFQQSPGTAIRPCQRLFPCEHTHRHIIMFLTDPVDAESSVKRRCSSVSILSRCSRTGRCVCCVST